MRSYFCKFKMTAAESWSFGGDLLDHGPRPICRGEVEYNAREWDSYDNDERTRGLLEYAKQIATGRYPSVDWTGAEFLVEDCGYRGEDAEPVIEVTVTDEPTPDDTYAARVRRTTAPVPVVAADTLTPGEECAGCVGCAPNACSQCPEGPCDGCAYRLAPWPEEGEAEPLELNLKGELLALADDFNAIAARAARIAELVTQKTSPPEEANRNGGEA